MKSDAFVIDRVMQGEREAFAVLAERYLPMVRAIGLAQTRNAEDADDVAQEALLKAYTSLGSLRDRKRFGPWLASIARNAAVSLVRRGEHHAEFVRRERKAVVLEPDMVQRELYARVRQYIDELDAPLRETVLLHYFAGMKLREIAEVTDVTGNAAEKRLVRARAALGERILGELTPSEAERVSKGEVRKLMGLVAAAPPPWTALGTAAMPAPALPILGGLVMGKKVFVSVAVCAAVVFSLWGGLHAFKTWNSPAEERSVIADAGGESANRAATEPPAGAEVSASGVQGGEAASPVPLASETGAPELAEPLTPDEEEGAEIHGHVLDAETGEGISGVVVRASREEGGESVKYPSAPTDGEGGFIIPGLSPGAYEVQRRRAEGYQSDGWNTDIKNVTLEAGTVADGPPQVKFPLLRSVK